MEMIENMETPKRNRDQMSPDGKLSPPLKLHIIKRSPKERREEIVDIVGEIINPVKRDLEGVIRQLEEANTKLQTVSELKDELINSVKREANMRVEEMRAIISEMKELKTETIDQIKAELSVKNKQLESAKCDNQELDMVKQELIKMKVENGKLKLQQKKQEKYNRKSNVIMKGFMDNTQGQETRFDCKKKVLHMLREAGIDLPPHGD